MRTPVGMNGEGADLPLEGLTLRGALQRGTARLAEGAIDNAALDAEVLLRHVLRLERNGLYRCLHDRLSPPDREKFEKLLERRAVHEPVAYITGKKEFWSLDFIVTPAVLIPRPETELLIELALQWDLELGRSRRLNILDIGTGGGAIAVSMAKQLPEAQLWAVDISSPALAVAGVNAKRHGVQERVTFMRGDLFDALDKPGVMFDLIVSNPPYIRTAELAGLEPEILNWEPLMALDGGADGLDYYRRIIGAAPDYLNEGGLVIFEIGADLGDAIVELFARAGYFAPASVHRDPAGRNRAVVALKGEPRG
jgi:release factor glutamine methyltransferase